MIATRLFRTYSTCCTFPNVSQIFRIGSVSYLNAKPLIFGLENSPDIKLSLDVPANLLRGLATELLDVALLPVIDFQRLPGLRMLDSGGIGSDGETLTVRIFSPKPLKEIQTLACDPESHTSVALAQIVMAETFGIRPRLINLGPDVPSDAARLLIGDKVVTQQPTGMEHQLDLGAAWKNLTGMPFVFAVWTARGDVELGDLPARLERARREGLANLPKIIQQFAVPTGWPADLAMKYLKNNLKFEVGPREFKAIGRFFEFAVKHGILPSIRGNRRG